MVQLTLARLIRLNPQSIGPRIVRGPKYNHRKPLQYQKFQKRLVPEEIVERYSKEEHTGSDLSSDSIDPNSLFPGLGQVDYSKNKIFQAEIDRQRAVIARIEKIRVELKSIPGAGTVLMMNKNVSTPYDCARHINEMLTNRSVVAEVNFKTDKVISQTEDSCGTLWDMHRPLEQDCTLKFRHFMEEDVMEVNKAYWRSCSFLLGMAIKLAFKNEIKVMLHSWPKPNPSSGSFVYDAAINLAERWAPSEQELRAFTKILWDLKSAKLRFQRLSTSPQIAREIFHDNNFKLMQIDSMLSKNNVNHSEPNQITMYRCGGHIDLSIGPMIANTSQIGRITLASVHSFEPDNTSQEARGLFYRFQGVSLPQQLPLNSFIYQNILLERAKKFNPLHTVKSLQ